MGGSYQANFVDDKKTTVIKKDKLPTLKPLKQSIPKDILSTAILISVLN